MTLEREFQLTKTYEGPPFPNNEFAMGIYNKLYGKGQRSDSNLTPSAHLVTNKGELVSSPSMSWQEQICQSPVGRMPKQQE